MRAGARPARSEGQRGRSGSWRDSRGLDEQPSGCGEHRLQRARRSEIGGNAIPVEPSDLAHLGGVERAFVLTGPDGVVVRDVDRLGVVRGRVRSRTRPPTHRCSPSTVDGETGLLAHLALGGRDGMLAHLAEPSWSTPRVRTREQLRSRVVRAAPSRSRRRSRSRTASGSASGSSRTRRTSRAGRAADALRTSSRSGRRSRPRDSVYGPRMKTTCARPSSRARIPSSGVTSFTRRSRARRRPSPAKPGLYMTMLLGTSSGAFVTLPIL